jgi:hypothetical protein
MECSHYSLIELHLREIPASASKQSIARILTFEAVKRETVGVAFTESGKLPCASR